LPDPITRHSPDGSASDRRDTTDAIPSGHNVGASAQHFGPGRSEHAERQAVRERRGFTATLRWLAYDSPVARQMTADILDDGGPIVTQRGRDLAASIGPHL
jgi:hypothetical protein